MMTEDIKLYISNILPTVVFEETGEWLTLNVEPADLITLAGELNKGVLQLDYLFCVTCVDWKTHLTMVYHLSSSKNRQVNIVLKAKLNRDEPVIETVSHIWRTAEFHEREVFEMFGVQFTHHPDLRKLILEDDFEGYPLRKDFEDPINMIKL